MTDLDRDALIASQSAELADYAKDVAKLREQLVSVRERLLSPHMQAIGQEAIREHPHYDGGAVSAYGFAGAALKAVAAALTDDHRKLCPNGLEHGNCLHPNCVESCPGRIPLT